MISILMGVSLLIYAFLAFTFFMSSARNENSSSSNFTVRPKRDIWVQVYLHQRPKRDVRKQKMSLLRLLTGLNFVTLSIRLSSFLLTWLYHAGLLYFIYFKTPVSSSDLPIRYSVSSGRTTAHLHYFISVTTKHNFLLVLGLYHSDLSKIRHNTLYGSRIYNTFYSLPAPISLCSYVMHFIVCPSLHSMSSTVVLIPGAFLLFTCFLYFQIVYVPRYNCHVYCFLKVYSDFSILFS